jgi:putative membrane protein
MTAAVLAAVLAFYLLGARKTSTRWAWFIAGWIALAIALVAIDPWADRSFAGHMVQHELIMLVAAPLLVVARPLATLLWPLPYIWRRRVGRLLTRESVRRGWGMATLPAVAWTIQAVLLWSWHMPALFERAVENPWIHAFQHCSFFAGAVLFWWSVIHRSRGVAVLSLFTTAVQSGALGALLAFSPSRWYPAYAIDDQHLAGLLMWIPGGAVYLGAALLIISRYLKVAPTASAY